MFFKKPTVLMEKYIGTSKNLQLCEIQIKKIIDKLNKEDYDSFKARERISPSDENKTLEKLLTKEFDVKNISITWDLSKHMDAHTIVTAFPILDDAKNLENYKMKGRHSNPNLNVYITISAGMIKTYKLTEREILAILLHEIGHNLDATLLRLYLFLPIIITSPPVILIIPAITYLYAEIEKLSEKLYSVPVLNKLNTIIDNIGHFINDTGFSEIQNIINTFRHFLNGGSVALPGLSNVLGYGREVSADSFAQTYGYGPELATGLEKLYLRKTTFDKAVAKVPLLRTMLQLQRLSIMLLVRMLGLGVHPDFQTRYVRVLNKCKRDAQDKSLDPKLRKSLENEIAALEKGYAALLNSESEKKNNYVMYIYRKVVDKMFSGKLDIRELLSGWWNSLEDID